MAPWPTRHDNLQLQDIGDRDRRADQGKISTSFFSKFRSIRSEWSINSYDTPRVRRRKILVLTEGFQGFSASLEGNPTLLNVNSIEIIRPISGHENYSVSRDK